MDWIPQIFRRSKIYDDLTEEIRLHMEERTEQLMREGMSPKEAGREARLAFGNRTLLEERSREVWQWPALESVWADVRFSLRQLRRSRGITVAAVFTLALAIGANAIVFGLMDGLILRPLNVPQSESLYGTNHTNNPTWQSYPEHMCVAAHEVSQKVHQSCEREHQNQVLKLQAQKGHLGVEIAMNRRQIETHRSSSYPMCLRDHRLCQANNA
jgi:hypothetical protein